MTTSDARCPKLITNLDTLHQSSSGGITGVIYWQFESVAFPEVGWNDFPIVILLWWSQSVKRLVDSTSSIENLDFMDGPYSIECQAVEEMLVLQSIDRNKEEKERLCISNANYLRSEIIQCGKTIARHCNKLNYSSQDIENLDSFLGRCDP